jgi:hypothetical protein
MGPLYTDMIKANPNNMDLGGEIRLLMQAFGKNSCPTVINVLCKKYPNDFELGEKFREFVNKRK